MIIKSPLGSVYITDIGYTCSVPGRREVTVCFSPISMVYIGAKATSLPYGFIEHPISVHIEQRQRSKNSLSLSVNEPLEQFICQIKHLGITFNTIEPVLKTTSITTFYIILALDVFKISSSWSYFGHLWQLFRTIQHIT